MKNSRYAYLLWCIGIFFILFSTSCENNIQTVQSQTSIEGLPVESAIDVEMIYSDDGKVEMLMKCKKLDKYESEESYLEMPEGIDMSFYDSLMNVESSLTANYAISYEDTKMMEAKDDVVVINKEGEKLNTEHLIWDQNKAIIYSNVFVKITTKDEVLFGQGFESDENFDKWTIKKPTGDLSVEE